MNSPTPYAIERCTLNDDGYWLWPGLLLHRCVNLIGKTAADLLMNQNKATGPGIVKSHLGCSSALDPTASSSLTLAARFVLTI